LILKSSKNFPGVFHVSGYRIALKLGGLHSLRSQRFITQSTVRAGILVVHPENLIFR
jgi:hypothetical protein